MSKKAIPILSTIIAVIVIAVASFMIIRVNAKFELDNNLYGDGQLVDITVDDVDAKVADRQSFALFVSQPGCRTADDLREIVKTFATSHQLTIYEVDYSGLRESGLVPGLKFYPSFVIFRQGKPVDFLEADSREDANAYTELDSFSTWFTDHVIIKD